MVEGRRISRAAAKQVLEEMVHGGEDPEAIAGRLDLSQIVDEGALERLVDEALEGNPDLVATYLSGKTRAIDALVGKVMGRSKGKANPQAVREILARKLVH
jgi:aspartyl-tRNA(Asn)/glutamyl-tRNA(Gln) amidotransferase subunit B